MSKKRQKLELTWIGKDEQPQLEPRILVEDPSKSYGDAHAQNMLIRGDNLLALKALEQQFTAKVKCIYVDPPFNTGQAFEHYDDGIEHSLWLQLMRDRINVLRGLLTGDGTFCVHIDDNELGYLIALCDEIFGRRNRCYIVTFKQSSVSGPKAVNPGLVTTSSFVLIYARDKSKWSPSKVFVATDRDSRYSKYIVNFEEPYSDWKLITLRDALAQSEGVPIKEFKKKCPDKIALEKAFTEFVLRDPRRVVRTARVAPKDINAACRDQLQASTDSRDTVFKASREGKNDMFFLNGEQLIFYSSKAKVVDGEWVTGQAASTIWDDLLSNNLHKEGGVIFPNGKKPEGLLKRLLDMCTEPGDWVLDSFAGSGTTGAVAHKLGRKWVMVELGDHADSHILPRLSRVADGTDQDGASKAAEWKGGGGFKYYELAPSLLKADSHGNWVISDEYNADMLAAAMAKHEAFNYSPDPEIYWKQGKSSEKDFIFTTTSFVQVAFLDRLHEEMQEDEHLLICCKKYSAACAGRYPNIEIKKIPKMLLGKCEFGRDDYSLNIVNVPTEEDAPEFVPQGPPEPAPIKQKPKRKKGGRPGLNQQDLFRAE